MQQQDYSAPSADCDRFHAHLDRLRSRSSTREDSLPHAHPGRIPPLDESLVTERPQELLKMWETWDRRVTDHIARQQGHVPTSSYASPTRSSAGKVLTSSSTTKSRRKLFLSVLGVDEPVDIARPRAAAHDVLPPAPVPLEVPTSEPDLVPYVPEDDVPVIPDVAHAPATVPSKKIPHERLERLRQRRQERSSSADVIVAPKVQRTALEELAMLEQEQPHDDPQTVGSAKPPRPKTLRSKQHMSPRAKKHLLTKVRSRQSGSGNPPVVVKDAVAAVHTKSADSSNEADFASSSCDPKVIRVKKSSRAHAHPLTRSAEDNETTREPSADAEPSAEADNDENAQEDCDAEDDENDHVYSADARCSRNVQWNHLEGARNAGEEEDEEDRDDGNEAVISADDQEVSEMGRDHVPSTSAERLLEELLDAPQQPSADDALVSGGDAVSAQLFAAIVSIFDAENEVRLDTVYAEMEAQSIITSVFSRCLWELQVLESEVADEELTDRLRLSDAESFARTELARELQTFFFLLQDVARVVEAEEELVRMDIVAFELESRYDFLVLPTVEANCGEDARKMIGQLDADQAAIVEEMEALHEDELAAEKEHTRSLVEEYEQLVQYVTQNSQNDKEELVRVLLEEKTLALESAEEKFCRERETCEMQHEDNLSNLRQQHTHRKNCLQRATADTLAKLRRVIDEASDDTTLRSAFHVWRHVAARRQWDKAMKYEMVERASNDEYVARCHKEECDGFNSALFLRDETIARARLEEEMREGLLAAMSQRLCELSPQLNTFLVQSIPQRAEKQMLEHDNASLRCHTQTLEGLVRKLSHLLRAQKMTSTALASKCEQHQVLDRAQRHEIQRTSRQRNGVVDLLSAAVTHQLLQRSFVRWLSLASSEPLKRLRKLRQEEQALRNELRCWHEQAASTGPRDFPPLHSPLILSNQHFAEKLRSNGGVAAKPASPGAEGGKISGDDAFNALKQLLAKERHITSSLREEVSTLKGAMRENSDALEESIRHREGLQRTLHDVINFVATRGIQLPQHLVSGGIGKGQSSASTGPRRPRPQGKSVGFADGAGASDPFEPGLT